MITGIFLSLDDHGWGNKPGSDGGGDGGKGGQKPDQGPPDLEELWHNFNRRIAALFGKQPSGNDDGKTPRPPVSPRAYGGGVALVVGLIVLGWLVSGFYVVDASERGVVLQFGRYLETTEPGLHWRLPAPIQTHEIVKLDVVRTVEIGYRGSEKNKMSKEGLMLTEDENIVGIQFAVQYQLNDPQKYLFNNRNVDDTVMQAAETAIREVVGKSKIDSVLYGGRDKIADNTQALMQSLLDRYESGIQVRAVTMQGTQAPEQAQAAFDDAVKAGQDRERFKSEGLAYANDVIPRARGTAARLLAEATAYRSRMIATAEGDASRFKQVLAEYSKAPEVTRTRMYLETLQQVYSNTSKVMIDAKGQGNLLYLPLDKLMAATAAQNAAPAQPATADAPPRAAAATAATADNAAAAAPEKAPPSEASADSRSRELLRSRERGER